MEKNFLFGFCAVILTIICGTIYIAVQQNYRQSANDPQIQMAEDAAAALSAGQTAPESAVPGMTVDMNISLAPFVVVYNEKGQPLAASGRLEGKIAVPPAGVLEYAKNHGEDRITWQPKPGARFAAVITHFSNPAQSGFVLAARSLREVENRESNLLKAASLAWLASTATAWFFLWGVPVLRKNQ